MCPQVARLSSALELAAGQADEQAARAEALEGELAAERARGRELQQRLEVQVCAPLARPGLAWKK